VLSAGSPTITLDVVQTYYENTRLRNAGQPPPRGAIAVISAARLDKTPALTRRPP
jgi:hypothetical protein